MLFRCIPLSLFCLIGYFPTASERQVYGVREREVGRGRKDERYGEGDICGESEKCWEMWGEGERIDDLFGERRRGGEREKCWEIWGEGEMMIYLEWEWEAERGRKAERCGESERGKKAGRCGEMENTGRGREVKREREQGWELWREGEGWQRRREGRDMCRESPNHSPSLPPADSLIHPPSHPPYQLIRLPLPRWHHYCYVKWMLKLMNPICLYEHNIIYFWTCLGYLYTILLFYTLLKLIAGIKWYEFTDVTLCSSYGSCRRPSKRAGSSLNLM